MDDFGQYAERWLDLDRRTAGRGARTPRFVGAVVDGGAMPTTTGRYYLVNPVILCCTEVEGSPASPVVDTSRTIPVAVFGSQAPAAGDLLHCFAADFRWVAERGAGGSTTPYVDCLVCNTSLTQGVPYDLDFAFTTAAGTFHVTAHGPTVPYLTDWFPIPNPPTLSGTTYTYMQLRLGCQYNSTSWRVDTYLATSSTGAGAAINTITSTSGFSPTQYPFGLVVTWTHPATVPGPATYYWDQWGFLGFRWSDPSPTPRHCGRTYLQISAYDCPGAWLSGAVASIYGYDVDTATWGTKSATVGGTSAIPVILEVTGDVSPYWDVRVQKTGYADAWLRVPGYALTSGGITTPGSNPFTLRLQTTATATPGFQVKGCNGLGLPGASLTYPALNGYVATSDSSGNFAAQSFANGTYPWTISADRFVAVAGTTTVSGCATTGNPTTQTMTPAAGYYCTTWASSACALPVSGTLHATFSGAGARVFTYAAGNWVSTFVYGGDTYTLTLSPSGTISGDRGGMPFPCSFSVSSCPPALSATITAGGIGAGLGSGTLTE